MSLVFSWVTLTSIWILGLTIATQEKMLLHFIRRWAEKKESSFYEAVLLCIWCMSSLHSIIGYGFLIGIGVVDEFSWRHLVAYPIVVCGSSFLSGMLWAIYLRIGFFDIEEDEFNNN